MASQASTPPPPQKARSGAKDVALLAGVSTATVSRVLNNSPSVDPATRQKVLDAAAKLRYVPHGAARTLRSHRSKMVGAIVPSFDYALYARTTSALQQRLDEHGYALVLAEHHYELAVETRIAGRIGHYQRLVGQDGVSAEGDVARGFAGIEPGARLEPLAVAVDQRDQGDRHVQQTRGGAGDAVERFFGGAPQEIGGVERGKALCFIQRDAGSVHAFLP